MGAARGDLVVDGRRVAEALLADTFPRRLRGMLGRRPLPPAMLFRPGGAVHGVGMTADLDVAMLDADGRVTKVAVLRPFRQVTAGSRAVRSVLEAPAGSFETWGLGVGSTVGYEPAATS